MIIRNCYNEFPKTNKTIEEGDIWYAKFPYQTKGNLEKLRPVYVKKILNNNNFLVCMITTNKNNGKLLKIDLSCKNRYKHMKTSYININKESILDETKFYSKLKKGIKLEEMI